MRAIRNLRREFLTARFLKRTYFEIKYRLFLEYGIPQKFGRALLFITKSALIIPGLIFVFYYFYSVEWTGFYNSDGAKTLWDWLALLIVPGVLSLGALLISERLKQNERMQTADTLAEGALQSYIDSVSDILLKEVSSDRVGLLVALLKASTHSTLDRISPARKRTVFRLLIDSGLLDRNENTAYFLAMANFSAINLEHIHLEGLNLQGINLSKATGHKVNFGETSFSGGDFRQADFSLLQVRDCEFAYANLDGASFYSANFFGKNGFINARMNKVDMRNAYVENAIMRDVEFVDADLRNARMSGAYLRGADFSYANLERANLTKADLSLVNFEGAKLRGAVLDGVNLTKARITLRQLRSAGSTAGAFCYIDEEEVFRAKEKANIRKKKTSKKNKTKKAKGKSADKSNT